MAGEITVGDLVEDVWRLNAGRIIVGEVRGPEVLAMLNVMAGGAGSMSTVHADTARAAIERLITLAMGAGPQVTADYARRQVAEHIDLIVQLRMHEQPTGRPGRVPAASLRLRGHRPGAHRRRARGHRPVHRRPGPGRGPPAPPPAALAARLGLR